MRGAVQVLSVLLLGFTSMPAQDAELAKLREKLARENDAADRAKISVKIGQRLLQQLGKKYKKEAYEEAEGELAEYVEVCRTAYEELQKSGRDARRKPKGFKDLEIHLRKGTRKLSDIARHVVFERRPPLERAAADMEEMRQQLLRALMKVED